MPMGFNVREEEMMVVVLLLLLVFSCRGARGKVDFNKMRCQAYQGYRLRELMQRRRACVSEC